MIELWIRWWLLGGMALGAAVMTACNLGKLALQLLLMPVIARLLGPEAYGLYSVALPSVIVVLMLADGGLGQSLAREDESETLVWSSAFWMLLGLGLILSAGLTFWSFPLAALAHQPALPSVMAPLSLTALLLVLAVSPSARLLRRGRIEVYAVVDLGATLAGVLVAVTSAALGAGVWSLVAQMLTLYALRALVLNLIAPGRPRALFRLSAVANHTRVGGGVVAAKLIESGGRMLEAGVVSRRFGASAVGAYGFANTAAWSLVQAAVNPLWTALYARSLRGDDEATIRALHGSLLRLALLLTLPATCLLWATASVVVPTLLGPAWLNGAALIGFIFPSQALASCGQLSGAVMYARGRSGPQAGLALVNALLRTAAVIIPLAGWGQVAPLLACANLAAFFAGVVTARIVLGWSFGHVLAVCWRPVVVALVAGAAARIVMTEAGHGLGAAVAAVAAGGGVALLTLLVIDGANFRRDLQVIARTVGRPFRVTTESPA